MKISYIRKTPRCHTHLSENALSSQNSRVSFLPLRVLKPYSPFLRSVENEWYWYINKILIAINLVERSRRSIITISGESIAIAFNETVPLVSIALAKQTLHS